MSELDQHPAADPIASCGFEPHLAVFIDRLRGVTGFSQLSGQSLFDGDSPIMVSRAPGRLDVMGGIADYSGSLVLQWPIREAAFVAAQADVAGGLKIVSLATGHGQETRVLELDAQTTRELLAADYGQIRSWFASDPTRHWAAYVVGVLAVLRHERGLEFNCGLRILVESRVPEGKGVSSSAALEVATMQAVTGLLGREIDGAELARLCQTAENFVVGAPCGIMDQMTSALGQADALLALLCQPAQVQGFVTLPPSIGFWGIDSGIRHAVSGSDYTSVRTGAFMGYRMITDRAGLRGLVPSANQPLVIVDPRWTGYLANISPSEFDLEFASHLPETMSGQEFLARYSGTTDRVTQVDPSRTYAVRQPTAHPIREHARVRQFSELLGSDPDEPALLEMGELMYDSHASYSDCGLGSDGTDLLVDMVRQTGSTAGLFGAKITGGGSGGTVAILGRSTAGPAVEPV
jgi:L-arabinokinase